LSPVFAAMFRADMVKAKESTVGIVDFSIRAMIDFAYRRNVMEAVENSEMALELLQLADRYEIKDLMEIFFMSIL